MMIAAHMPANHVEPAVERAVKAGFRESDSLCRHAARRARTGAPPAHDRRGGAGTQGV